jgi:hypothetical protein
MPQTNRIFNDTSVPRSEVTVDTGNGYGSTNTKIRRFSNIRKNVGSAITYADSSTLGGTFTINEVGIYSITYCDKSTTTTQAIAIVVNGTALTTNPDTPITYAQGLRGMVYSAINFTGSIAWTGNLNVGDIVYLQTNLGSNVTDSNCMVTIVKVSN